MPSRDYTIFAGSPAEAASTLQLLSSGSEGDQHALRRLVHPDPLIPPLIYYSNPNRTINFDQVPLRSPITKTVRTLDTTAVVRFETATSDVIISEIWSASQNDASMPTSFFRRLFEIFINPPEFDPITPEYVQWEPRDRSDDGTGNTRVYNVEILRLTVGGGGEANQLFDVADLRTRGGLNDTKFTGTTATPNDTLDSVLTGLVDRTVVLQFKIVNEVVS